MKSKKFIPQSDEQGRMIMELLALNDDQVKWMTFEELRFGFSSLKTELMKKNQEVDDLAVKLAWQEIESRDQAANFKRQADLTKFYKTALENVKTEKASYIHHLAREREKLQERNDEFDDLVDYYEYARDEYKKVLKQFEFTHRVLENVKTEKAALMKVLNSTKNDLEASENAKKIAELKCAALQTEKVEKSPFDREKHNLIRHDQFLGKPRSKYGIGKLADIEEETESSSGYNSEAEEQESNNNKEIESSEQAIFLSSGTSTKSSDTAPTCVAAAVKNNDKSTSKKISKSPKKKEQSAPVKSKTKKHFVTISRYFAF